MKKITILRMLEDLENFLFTQKEINLYIIFEMLANKMKSISERRFCEGNIGESVKIKIPDVDKTRSDL